MLSTRAAAGPAGARLGSSAGEQAPSVSRVPSQQSVPNSTTGASAGGGPGGGLVQRNWSSQALGMASARPDGARVNERSEGTFRGSDASSGPKRADCEA